MSSRPDIPHERIGVHPIDWEGLPVPEGLDEGTLTELFRFRVTSANCSPN